MGHCYVHFAFVFTLTHFALINRAEFKKNVLMGGNQVPSDAMSVTGF